MAALQRQLEPTQLLSAAPQERPADTLIVAPPAIRPNSWRRFPRLALDIAVSSPFQHTTLHEAAREVLASSKRYSQHKRNSRGLGDRCAAANIGYEPVAFESLGGLEKGGEDLLKSIYALGDARLHRRPGESYHE